MKKIIIGIVVVILLVLGTWYVLSSENFGPSLDNGAAHTETENVAVVNGEEISRTDFEALEAQVVAQQGLDLATLDAETRSELQTQVVDSLVAQELLKQAAMESNVTATEVEVDAQIESIKGQFESEEMYEQILALQGMTEEELRTQISNELVVQNYLEQELALSSVTATDAEIMAVYDQAAAQGEVPPFEEVQEEVKAATIQQKQGGLVEALIGELRAEADITILL